MGTLVTIAGAAWLASAVVRLVEWLGGDRSSASGGVERISPTP